MMDKNELLRLWAGELIRVKAQLLQVSWLLNQGVKLNRQQMKEFDRLLDQKNYLERLFEEYRDK